MCPPWVDQTMRSSQGWRLAAPDIKQVNRLFDTKNQHAHKAFNQHIFTDHPPLDVYPLLARPIISPSYTVPVQSQMLAGDGIQTHKDPFQRLSNEILDMILEELEEESADVIGLALTSTFLWNVAANRIRQLLVRQSAPWANTRILFQGSYSQTLPPGFVCEEEVVPTSHGRGRGFFGGKCAARRFFSEQGQNDEVITPSDRLSIFKQAMESHREQSGVPSNLWQVLDKQFDITNFFPRHRIWVLRNLSKHEFVTSDALHQYFGRSCVKKKLDVSEPITFEDILLIRACWTSIPSREERELDCHEGIWAGDCFDLVPIDEHTKSDVTQWRDVSKEVVVQARRLRNVILRRRAANERYGLSR